jgi:hypothetical protein
LIYRQQDITTKQTWTCGNDNHNQLMSNLHAHINDGNDNDNGHGNGHPTTSATVGSVSQQQGMINLLSS